MVSGILHNRRMPQCATADLCDQHGDVIHVLPPGLLSFGGVTVFSGTVTTLRVHEDNQLVRTVLGSPGHGGVLVIDGGGSVRTALVGGRLGQLAADSGWSGVVVWGAVRDALELAASPVGIRALATCPRPPQKTGAGQRDVPVTLGGITITSGMWLAADADGVVVAPSPLG
jgi:regulator of ribonuclease activity A